MTRAALSNDVEVVEPDAAAPDFAQEPQNDVPSGPVYLAAKRAIDVVVSLLLLFVAVPIIFCISIYVRGHLPGTSVFRQTRIRQDRRNGAEQPPLFYADPATGRILPERRKQDDVFKRNNGDCRKTTAIRFYRSNGEGGLEPDRRRHDLCGQPFVLYKFATMYPDARARFPKLYEYSYTREEIHRLRFKVPDDPRVPEWAQWLRKTSLDELPNFMNVLRGDMTLVGPRPDIPEMTQYYTAEQRLKLRVKPGITGLAQIMGRGNLTFQQTLAYDLQYVRNRSLLLDLKILYATAVALFADQNGAH